MSHSKTTLVKNISLVTLVKLANNVLGIFRGIFIAAVLSVEIYGVFKLIQVFIQYAGYLTLGISSAANRELSISMGTGNRKEFQLIQNTALVFILFIGFSISILAILGYASGLNYESIFNWPIVGLFCLIVFGNKLNEFFTALLASQSRFVDLSLSTILKGFVSTVFVVVLVKHIDIYGVLLALFLGIFSFLLSAYFRLKPTFSFNPVYKKLRSLLKVGLSIVMLKEGHFVFWSVCTLLVSKFNSVRIISI